MAISRLGHLVGLSHAREEADVYNQRNIYERKIADLEKQKADEDRKANVWARKFAGVIGTGVGAAAGGLAGTFLMPGLGTAAGAGLGAALGGAVGNMAGGYGLKDTTQFDAGIAQSQQAIQALSMRYSMGEGLRRGGGGMSYGSAALGMNAINAGGGDYDGFVSGGSGYDALTGRSFDVQEPDWEALNEMDDLEFGGGVK